MMKNMIKDHIKEDNEQVKSMRLEWFYSESQ
jgi:hypothetical protein